jgi:hypothetical protein
MNSRPRQLMMIVWYEYNTGTVVCRVQNCSTHLIIRHKPAQVGHAGYSNDFQSDSVNFFV